MCDGQVDLGVERMADVIVVVLMVGMGVVETTLLLEVRGLSHLCRSDGVEGVWLGVWICEGVLELTI